MIFKVDLLTKQIEELLESWRDLSITEELFLGYLTSPLM
jgi:hypothetical protein